MNEQKNNINLGVASKQDLPSPDKDKICWGGNYQDHLSPEHNDALSRGVCFQHHSQQVKQLSLCRGGNSKKIIHHQIAVHYIGAENHLVGAEVLMIIVSQQISVHYLGAEFPKNLCHQKI